MKVWRWCDPEKDVWCEDGVMMGVVVNDEVVFSKLVWEVVEVW